MACRNLYFLVPFAFYNIFEVGELSLFVTKIMWLSVLKLRCFGCIFLHVAITPFLVYYFHILISGVLLISAKNDINSLNFLPIGHRQYPTS